MKSVFRRTLPLFLGLLALPAASGHAEILTHLDVGNTAAESAAGVLVAQAPVVDTADSALGDTARRLVPASAGDTASITFTANVSPSQPNYITLRVWGGDTAWGAIHLAIADSNLNLGSLWRHTVSEPPFHGRFIYRTVVIPIEFTLGQTSLVLRLQTSPSPEYTGGIVLGEAPAPKPVNQPSCAIYDIYTHTTPWFTPPPEAVQGQPFVWGPPVEKPAGASETLEDILVGRARADIETALQNNIERSQFGPGHRRDIAQLAAYGLIYWTPWSGHHFDSSIPPRVRNAIDLHVQRQSAQGGDPGSLFSSGWDAHGQIALAYSRLHDVFAAKGWLDEPVSLKSSGRTITLPRRQAYANFFQDAFEWRRSDRRPGEGRALRSALAITRLQRALRALGDPRALSEAQTLRYAHEALGLVPLRASEFGIVAADANYPYAAVTGAGLFRDPGYAADTPAANRALVSLAEENADEQLKAQARKIAAARAIFRIPANGPAGERVLRGISSVDWLAPAYPGRVAYAGIDEAAVLEDPALLRLAQLEIEHGRYFIPLKARDADWDPADSIRLVEHYRKIKDLPPTETRLPMEPGAPDSVWADAEIGVFAFRHGDTIAYGSFFNNDSSEGRAVGDLGVLEFIRPDMARLVDFRPSASLPRSGRSLVVKLPFGERSYAQPPPPAGIADWRESPPDAIDRRAGLAYFYRLQYGDYLVGMNTTRPGTYRETSYDLAFPDDASSAIDVATGRPVGTKKPLSIAPGETRVLFLQR